MHNCQENNTGCHRYLSTMSRKLQQAISGQQHILLLFFLFAVPLVMAENPNPTAPKFDPVNAQIAPLKHYNFFFDSPASLDMKGWEQGSVPLGNGYFGVNFFGGVGAEIWQISEKSVWMTSANPKIDQRKVGLTSLCELRLLMNHGDSNYKDYSRALDVSQATGKVNYTIDGIAYERELITSYPGRVFAVHLTASQKGKLSFTLKTLHSDLCDYRHGTIETQGATLVLKGEILPYKNKYQVNVRVKTNGGSCKTNTSSDSGEFVVEGANEALVLVSLGSNYRLESRVFTEPKKELKLAGFEVDSKLIDETLNKAEAAGWSQLLTSHVTDYKALFDRVQIDLGGRSPQIPIDQLLKVPETNTPERRYLEELIFQHGRYLLISASRKGTLPAHLQGIWNWKRIAPWAGNYTADENIEMAYWPAFVTNLEETFPPYLDYFLASFQLAQLQAKRTLKLYHSPQVIDNGWAGNSCSPYDMIFADHWSSVGVSGYLLERLWAWYEYTDDPSVLEKSWPIMLACSRFYDAYLQEQADGKLLCNPSWSPENPENRAGIKGNKKDFPLGYKLVSLVGTSFDQQMVYENFSMVLKAAKILGKDDPILPKLRLELSKLDPIQIGTSGQIKEFRQEDAYGSIGDPKHRHISHLIGLYPYASLAEKKEWLDACKVTLNGRGDESTGWGMAHRLNCWARLKDGEKSYQLVSSLITKATYPNLWHYCPPFQFDGSEGYTSGIAEMLLQSHEGYINPIPALPKEWAAGSYSGLCARGAFAISAAWKEGQLTKLLVTSMKGKPCRILVNSGWNVFAANGDPVKYSYDGVTHVFSFDTQPGELYILTRSAHLR